MQLWQAKLAALAADDEQHTLLEQLDQDLLLVEAQVRYIHSLAQQKVQLWQAKLAALAAEDEQHTLLEHLYQDLLLVEARLKYLPVLTCTCGLTRSGPLRAS